MPAEFGTEEQKRGRKKSGKQRPSADYAAVATARLIVCEAGESIES
jgi:hypothetical protein